MFSLFGECPIVRKTLLGNMTSLLEKEKRKVRAVAPLYFFKVLGKERNRRSFENIEF